MRVSSSENYSSSTRHPMSAARASRSACVDISEFTLTARGRGEGYARVVSGVDDRTQMGGIADDQRGPDRRPRALESSIGGRGDEPGGIQPEEGLERVFGCVDIHLHIARAVVKGHLVEPEPRENECHHGAAGSYAMSSTRPVEPLERDTMSDSGLTPVASMPPGW